MAFQSSSETPKSPLDVSMDHNGCGAQQLIDADWVNANGKMVKASHIIDGVLSGFGSSDFVAANLACSLCIEKNEPTPLTLVTHRVRILLQQIDSSLSNLQQRKQMLVSLLEATLQPCDQFLRNRMTNTEVDTRCIEIQVLLRLQYWAMLGDDFVQLYRKMYLKRKKKRSGARQSSMVKRDNQRDLFNDIIDLLSSAAMKLPQSRPFPAFLESCLDKSFSSSGPGSHLPPDTYQNIYDYFEIINPDLSESFEEMVAFVQKPLPFQKEKRKPSWSSSANSLDTSTSKSLEMTRSQPQNGKQGVQTTTSQRDLDRIGQKDFAGSLIPQAIPLVAPASRTMKSLFANVQRGQRPRYVGSHFNTNLSNASSLFREVKVAKKKPTKRLNDTAILKNNQRVGSTISKRKSNMTNTHSNSSRKAILNDRMDSVKSKRKHSHCFLVNNASRPSKQQKPPFSEGLVQESLMTNAKTKSTTISREPMLNAQSARRVVVAARSALKRQG